VITSDAALAIELLTCRLVLLIIETLSLMLRESEIFAGRTACLKTDDGAVVNQLITLLVKRPISLDHLSPSQQVLVTLRAIC